MRSVFLLLDFWFLLRPPIFTQKKKTCCLIFSSLQTFQTISRGRSHLVGGFERGFAKKVGPPPEIFEIKGGGVGRGGQSKKDLIDEPKMPLSIHRFRPGPVFFGVIYRFPQLSNPITWRSRKIIMYVKDLRVLRYFYLLFTPD